MDVTEPMIDYLESLNISNDLRQDVYENLLTRDEEDFEDEAHMKKWLLGAVSFTQMNDRRKEANRARLREDNEHEIRSNLHTSEQFAADPLDSLMAEANLEDRLKHLSDMQRRVLSYMMVEGYTPEQIALREKTTSNVIYKRVHDIKTIMQRGKDNE